MKRVLAWIVMAVLEFVAMNLAGYLARFVVRIASSIISLHEGLFWVVVLLGGGGVIGLIIWLISIASGAVVALAEKIQPSTKGTRYIVFGSIMVALYGFFLIFDIIYHVKFSSILEVAAILLSVVVFMVVGHSFQENK